MVTGAAHLNAAGSEGDGDFMHRGHRRRGHLHRAPHAKVSPQNWDCEGRGRYCGGALRGASGGAHLLPRLERLLSGNAVLPRGRRPRDQQNLGAHGPPVLHGPKRIRPGGTHIGGSAPRRSRRARVQGGGGVSSPAAREAPGGSSSARAPSSRRAAAPSFSRRHVDPKLAPLPHGPLLLRRAYLGRAQPLLHANPWRAAASSSCEQGKRLSSSFLPWKRLRPAA